jgi:hypothetical protein
MLIPDTLLIGSTLIAISALIWITQLVLWFRERPSERIALNNFMWFAKYKQKWRFEGDNLQVKDFAAGLQQAAIDGDVEIFGRRADYFSLTNRDIPLTPIPAQYWDNHRIDMLSMLDNPYRKAGIVKDNFRTCVESASTGKNEYIDIHLNKTRAAHWLKAKALEYRGKSLNTHEAESNENAATEKELFGQ